jgi:hypothetical protein
MDWLSRLESQGVVPDAFSQEPYSMESVERVRSRNGLFPIWSFIRVHKLLAGEISLSVLDLPVDQLRRLILEKGISSEMLGNVYPDAFVEVEHSSEDGDLLTTEAWGLVKWEEARTHSGIVSLSRISTVRGYSVR